MSSVDTTRIYDSTSGWFKGNKSDVEEINGLITYDRKVIKVDCNKMKSVMDELYKEFQKENV